MGNHTENALNIECKRKDLLLYLLECALGIEQVVDHISRHTDEGGNPDAVAKDSGPRWVLIVEQPDLWREGEEADDDELDTV